MSPRFYIYVLLALSIFQTSLFVFSTDLYDNLDKYGKRTYNLGICTVVVNGVVIQD